jgi:hypothetical protein
MEWIHFTLKPGIFMMIYYLFQPPVDFTEKSIISVFAL